MNNVIIRRVLLLFVLILTCRVPFMMWRQMLYQDESILMDTIPEMVKLVVNERGKGSARPISTSELLDETRNRLLGCLSPSCIGQLGSDIARTYSRRKDSLWCSDKSKIGDIWNGIILVKTPKAGSSTSAGAALRLADRFNCSGVRWAHTRTPIYQNHSTDTLLFTSIRDPGARAISRVYFTHISTRSHLQKTKERALLDALPKLRSPQFGTTSNGQGGFQLSYISFRQIPTMSAWSEVTPGVVVDPTTVVRNVIEILNSYTIILVTERMDESLVALALLLDVDVGSVLVQPSKISGANYHYNRKQGTCRTIVSSQMFENVQRYIESDEWRAMNYGDYLLHAAANRSLDLTIASLQPEFSKAMSRYRTLQSLAKEKCVNETVYPCSPQGTPQADLAKLSCYNKDAGCGHRCVDRVIEEYDRAQTT